MTYHEFLAAEQQQATEGDHLVTSLPSLPIGDLCFLTEGRCVSGVQPAREYEQVTNIRGGGNLELGPPYCGDEFFTFPRFFP